MVCVSRKPDRSVDNTLLEVSSEICYSYVPSRYTVVMETTQLVLSQFNNFLPHLIEN